MLWQVNDAINEISLRILFSCNDFPANILNDNHQQSDNPAINEIVLQINRQMRNITDSRIIVFVREVDFTNYLTDIFNQNGIGAEAIIGCNAKSDTKSWKIILF